jgi:hypothetical protein
VDIDVDTCAAVVDEEDGQIATVEAAADMQPIDLDSYDVVNLRDNFALDYFASLFQILSTALHFSIVRH